MLIENVKSVNGEVAGVIVGLPESPVVGLTLRNVDLEAKTGVQMGYATVKLDDVQVKAEEGKGIVLGASATVTGNAKELPQ